MKPNKLLNFGFWILRRVYEEKLYHDISGDFEELYENRKAQKGKAIATIRFYVDVLLSIPNITRKLQQRTYTMISFDTLANYLKMGFRVLKKNPVTSFISIFGLAIAVGCATTGALWVNFQSNLDSFHTNRANIYQVTSHIIEEGTNVHYGASPLLLSEHLKQDHSEIANSTRVKHFESNVKRGSKVFREPIQFVDPAFLKVLDFPMLEGNQNALANDQVVISKEIAIKYFGDQDPIGEALEFYFDTGDHRSFAVAGVLDDIPENSSMKFSILLPFDHYKHLEKAIDWAVNTDATFVLLKEGVTPADIQNLFVPYLETQNAATTLFPVESFELIPLSILGNLADEIYLPIARGSSPSDYWSMGIMGYLMLVLACINYLNIAVSSGTKRLKEIALRKAMGGNRSEIIYQFLSENALICTFSLVVGLAFCYFLLLPGFNSIAPVTLPFAFSSWESAALFVLSVLLVMILLAGAYPSLYISKYQASEIFGGKQKFKRKNYLSKGLLTLQLFLAFTTVVASVVFTDNAMYVKEQDWGYDQHQLMSLRLPSEEVYDELKTSLISDPDVIQIVGSNGHVGLDNRMVDFEFLDKQFRTITYDVSSDYLKTLGFKLLKGSLFSGDNQSDANSVVVNQLFAEKMGWEKPVGQQFTWNDQTRTVIGVVDNVRHVFFSADEMRPMLFTNEGSSHNYLTIKYAGEESLRIEEELKEAFYQLAANAPFHLTYQDRIFDLYYGMVDANIKLMSFVGFMAIILSCLGLYGLMSFMIQSRIKEFGIRKVLGAGKKHIIRLTAKEYFWIMMISFGLGVPLGAFGVQSTVAALFSIVKPFSMVPILFALIITLSAIVLTVLKEIITLIRLNPVETLKDD